MSRKLVPAQYRDAKGVVAEGFKAGIGILASGTGAPTASTGGYSVGCLWVRSDGGAGTALYINNGSDTSSTWVAMVGEGGTFTALTVTTLTNLVMTRSAGAATDTYKANTAAAWTVTDGTTGSLVLDTRSTLKNISTYTITGTPVTVASETATHINASLNIAAKTVTYTGGTGTTATNGAMLYVGALTITDASAMTLVTASSVFINAIAAAGGMLTISNSYMIHTSISGAFLSNAGVWTDMACWESGKEMVKRGTDAAKGAIEKVLEAIVPATWKYKAMTELPAIDEQGNAIIHRTPIRDKGRERVGIVYDDLPESLRAPGEETAVSTGVLSSFALAAIKLLYEKNQALEARLAKLEAV